MEKTNHALPCEFSGRGFLAENPEAYGLLSDAHPIVTDKLLIAVGGYTPEDGTYPQTLTVEGSDLTDFQKGLFHPIAAMSRMEESVFRLNFGEIEGRQTHPLARYCAVAAELLTLDVLRRCREDGLGEDRPEACAELLAEAVTEGLEKIRGAIREMTGPRPGSEKFFEVSLGACDISRNDTGEYRVDFYSAGDYELYFLDRDGMRPMCMKETDVLCGDGRVAVRRFVIHAEGAFGLLLLSRAAGEPSPADQRGMVEAPGLLWRHRMRLEDQFVRVLVSAKDEDEAAEQFQRLLTGRCQGWDNVSGGFMICNGTYDDFKSRCLPRLTELESLIALFPEGYDPDKSETPVLLDTVEREYALNAFKTKPRVLEKTRETLSQWVMDMLINPDASDLPEPVGYDGVHRLTGKDIERVYADFDSENVQDRKRLKDHCLYLRDLFSEHWLKLRPLLCDLDADTPENLRAFEQCLSLQKRVARLTTYRRQKLNSLRNILMTHLERLDDQSEDWGRGKGGDDSPAAWFRSAAESISAEALAAEADWEKLSLYVRSLQTAYTWERHALFLRDTAEGTGIWHDEYNRILEGEFLPEEWRMYARKIEAEAPHYRELWRIAETLSARNVSLKADISARAAERRTANAVSDDEDWQISCLLGALQEDEAWNKLCGGMVDQGFRNEYRAVIRRCQEDNERILRQGSAFKVYREMYESFGVVGHL